MILNPKGYSAIGYYFCIFLRGFWNSGCKFYLKMFSFETLVFTGFFLLCAMISVLWSSIKLLKDSKSVKLNNISNI